MTTYIPFVQPTNQPMQFNATFDGNKYTVQVPWSLFGQRYYIAIYDQSSNLILYMPRIASTLTSNINLLNGYFTTSTLIWRAPSNNFEISP